MTHERRGSTKPGVWVWDDNFNELMFLSGDQQSAPKTAQAPGLSSSSSTQVVPPQRKSTVLFKETVGTTSQLAFRKIYQRKVKMTEADVVTIQDIKDVVIYTCHVPCLTTEFIKYFHTRAMDQYLRSLIVYFQYYFQIWNLLQLRRKEASRKLRQPIVTVLENYIRDDLADMRSMVARDYAVILMGIGDAKKFHHMSTQNNESLSDRDRRLFEQLMVMTVQVVWISLCRKYLTLIEKEMNRMLRTNIFNPHQHVRNPAYDTTPEEDRILIGKACRSERTLLHRSPAVQELTFDNHDYRMLAIGVTNTDCFSNDERQRYLEISYSAPEEELQRLKVPVGILGIPRKYFDAMLKPKELSTTRRISTLKPIGDFMVPPFTPYFTKSGTIPKQRSKYQETEATKLARKNQCKMWLQYVETGGVVGPELSLTLTTGSFLTAKTSPLKVDN